MKEFVKMTGITKVFPGVTATNNVDLSIKFGEIRAVVGENGAGKTTLMRILSGLVQPDQGKIYVKGQQELIESPLDAIDLKIGMIHQHFMLIPSLTVVENAILGKTPVKAGIFTDIKKAKEKMVGIADRYNLKVNFDAKVRDLSVGELQRVEILKALFMDAELLILDEPTAILTPQEVEGLFKMMREFAEKNKTIVFITHKLREVKAVAETLTVMRNGQVVGESDVADVSEHDIARMMVGREVLFQVKKSPERLGKEALALKNISTRTMRGLPALRNVSLTLREGEILGIAGVEGNGQRELVDCIFGMWPIESGRLCYYDKDISNVSIKKRRTLGMAYIPEDRMTTGLCMPMSISENLIMGSHNKAPFTRIKGIRNLKATREISKSMIEDFNIVAPHPDTVVQTLSGGNLQKVVFAREIKAKPKILIASQPTRGVDMGAIEFIHKRLVDFRDEGNAILLLSADLQELLNLSDRIAVIYEGEIVCEMPRNEATEQKLGIFMTGCLEARASS